MAESRIIIRIELLPGAKRGLEDVSDKRGMTQVAVCSRVLEWFAQQDDVIKSAVLGHYPKELAPDVAKIILGKLAAKKKK